MEETGQAVRNFLNRIKGFVKGHFKIIIIVVAIMIIIAGAVYTVMKWTAETVSMAARVFTSAVNISSNGVITTNISAQDLWNQMIEEGYEVNKYLDSPTELLKLLQAELVTKLPDTRSNVDKPVDWNDFFNKKASEKSEDNSGRASTEAVQGIIKFLRHDANGGQKYLTYASPSDFNSWVNEYKSTGSEDAKEKALSHFTLKKTLTKGSKKRASEGIEAVIAAAESQIGVPYSYEGSYACPKDGDNPGFNCSGLVWWAFEQAGYNVDHSQCAYDCEPPNRGMIDTVIANCGELIKDPEQLNRGDVLFYKNPNEKRDSGHVAIYLGNGERIHSNEEGVHIDSNAFHSQFIGGGPLIVEDTLPTSTTTSTSTSKSTSEKTKSKSTSSSVGDVSPLSTNESTSKKISKARYTGEAEKVDGDGYTQVYTSSTGITYKGYMQNQGSYKDNHYWDYDGGSIARDGCGPASIAVLASGLRQDLDYTPGDVVSMIQEEYGNNAVSYDSYMVWAMNKLGMECELTYFPNYANPSAEDVQLLQDTLREGKVMMIGTTNPPSIFPYSSGHFIAAVDINEQGQIYIINPNGKEGNGGLGWFDAEVVARGCDSIFVTDSGSAVTTRANSDGYLGYQAVVATWTQVDKSTDFHNSPHASEAASYLGVTPGSNTTYTMSTKTIDYESMVQPYTLSFDLLWTFLVLGQSKGFVMDWADLAYGSEIEVSIYDNLTTTTTIDDWHYKEETDVKAFGRAFYKDGDVEANCSVKHDHIYANGDTSVKQEDGQITKTVVTNQNTLTTELTKAHTWIADYDVNYTYSKNDGNTTTSEATRDNYTVIDWTDGSIEDDPCGEIKKKINDEIVGPVNTAYQEIAERENQRLMEAYLQTLDTVGDLGNATPAQAVQAKTITEADVNTDGVHVQTQVNHVDIVDSISNKVDTRKYTAGTPNFVINDGENGETRLGANGSGGSEIVGDTLEEKVWWALTDAGFSKEATAGVMGNIYRESTFNANSIENGFTYEEVMMLKDRGLGMCGWTTPNERKQALVNFAKNRGKQWSDEDIQVEFLVAELTGDKSYADGYALDGMIFDNPDYGATVSGWKNAATPEDAAYQYCWIFERPGIPDMDTRQQFARQYYNQFKDAEHPAGKGITSLDNFLFIGDSRYADGGAINSAIKESGNNITIKGVGSARIDEWQAVVNNGGRGTVQSTNVDITGNYSGISIQLGANSVLDNVDNATSQMKQLINKLKDIHPNTPIFVNSCLGVNSNANSSGYGWNVSEMQNCINSFNNKVKDYCNTTDNVYFVDISNDLMSSGFVKLEYESDGVHMDSTEGANKYVENLKNGIFGTNTSSRRRRKSGRENFVTLFNKVKYRDNKNNILSATEWLFEIMEENDKLANMVDLMKYLLYKATGINYGATDIEQIWQEYLNSFKSISAEGGSSGIPGVPGQVYDFLLQKGVPPIGAAAVMGNIDNESSFNPSSVNNGGYSGLCQWGSGRLQNLKNFASSKGKDWTDVNTQMEYLWKELNESYPKVKETIMNAKTEKDLEYATWYWGSHFEIYDSAAEAGFAASKNWTEEKERYNSAKYWYNEWKTHHTSSNSSSDVATFALQFEGKRQTEIPDFVGYTLSDGSITIFENEWCAMFASWCFDKCGLIPSKLTTGSTFADDLGEMAQSCGKFGYGGSYVPNSGDLIFFDWNPENGDGIDHVAIVVGTDGNSVTWIGGNQGDGGSYEYRRVTQNSASLSSINITGYWKMTN